MIQKKFCKRASTAPSPLAARVSLKQFPWPGWPLFTLDGVPGRGPPPCLYLLPVTAVALVMAVGLLAGAGTVGVVVVATGVTLSVAVFVGAIPVVGVLAGTVGVTTGVTAGVDVSVGVTGGR